MHFDDSSQIQNTPDSPFSEPFPDSVDFYGKTLQGSSSRRFWKVMSEVCQCVTIINFNAGYDLTDQTNISFPVFSGVSVWVWLNSDIARRIRSEWSIRYLSHRVVISPFRISGNLRQVTSSQALRSSP